MDTRHPLLPAARPVRSASRVGILRTAAAALTFAVALPAVAADGCLVMLCLAAPSWSSIPQCIEPVRQVLRDLARGRPFPSCPDANGGNAASNRWSSPPSFCPPQYLHAYDRQDTTAYDCDYAGAIEIAVNGALWARTWWNPWGDSVTEFMPAAKALMHDRDTRFDDDYVRWLATQSPASVACPSCQ